MNLLSAAVLMISAHWEEAEFTVMASPRPPMIYDYYGFSDYTYRICYDAPGDPALAAEVKTLIEAAGLPARLDAERGFDHGADTPLQVMYPRADVPVVQLSLKAGLDPATHLAAGRALAPLRDAGVLIIGSDLTYHNLRAFFSPRARRTLVRSTCCRSWSRSALRSTTRARCPITRRIFSTESP